MRLIDPNTGRTLLNNVEKASSIPSRFRGLMLRKTFGEGFGLWITPCRSVHTMWMRVPIDVYFIDQDDRVVEHHPAVRPWRVVVAKQPCRSVLEIPDPSVRLMVGATIRLQA